MRLASRKNSINRLEKFLEMKKTGQSDRSRKVRVKTRQNAGRYVENLRDASMTNRGPENEERAMASFRIREECSKA